MKQIFLLMIWFVSQTCILSAQDLIYQDKTGRLKWSNDKTDAYFWGVNYMAPFAHGYKQIMRNGADLKRTIDIDTYHLKRMGVDAFRIHVWDGEISDTLGNLLDNHHLNMLDYVLYKFQQHGIYTMLTPMNYYNNAYPEPNNSDIIGFTGKYSKGVMYIEPAAIAAQERYLKQFLSHLNPYTGKRYKDDPMIIAIEINNEPSHSLAKESTEYVKKMITAIRSTNCKKPIVYNATQSIRLLEDFIKGGTDGITFQWYPSGLVFNRERLGTFLPHVDIYDMPFKDEKYFANQSRIVYEFDPADIGRSYLYPPTAITFKEAGMQFVAMFGYDPLPIAASNTDYQTHWLNLVYSPQKAIGFKIAGELFRNPQYKRDRINEKAPFEMNDVGISYEKDLSELTTDQLFFYTNNTLTRPKNPATLQSITGYGSSPVVSYKGRGAYFLDKINNDTWRLEVYPDAVYVRDPFVRPSPRIENVVIKYNEYPMTVQLSGLGNSFSITGVNDGNRYSSTAVNGQFNITPGAYILSAKPFNGNPQQLKIGTIAANEYYAPVETNENVYFLHQPPKMIMESQPLHVAVEIVSPQQVKQITLQMSGIVAGGGRGGRPVQIPLEKQDRYLYSTNIPDTLVSPGILSYVIRVEYLSGKEVIYPGAVPGPTTVWDYNNPETYSLRVLQAKTKIELYNAGSSESPITWSSGLQLRTNYSDLQGETTATLTQMPARPGFTPRVDDRAKAVFAMEKFIKPQIEGISKYAKDYSKLVICAKVEKDPVHIEITLISKAGGVYTGKAILTSDRNLQTVLLKDLVLGKMMLLPRPFPGFQPFWYSNPTQKAFSLSEIERIQLVIPLEGNVENPTIEIKSIYLETV